MEIEKQISFKNHIMTFFLIAVFEVFAAFFIYLFTNFEFNFVALIAGGLIFFTLFIIISIYVVRKKRLEYKHLIEFDETLNSNRLALGGSITKFCFKLAKLEKGIESFLLLEGVEDIYKEDSLSSTIIDCLTAGDYFATHPKATSGNIVPISRSQTNNIDGYIEGKRNKACHLKNSPVFPNGICQNSGIAEVYKVTILKKIIAFAYTFGFFGFFLYWHLSGESIIGFFADVFSNIIPILFFIAALLALVNAIYITFTKTGVKLNGLCISNKSVHSFESLFSLNTFKNFINGSYISSDQGLFKKENFHPEKITDLIIRIKKTEDGIFESDQVVFIFDADEENVFKVPLSRECAFWNNEEVYLQRTKGNIVHSINSIYETFKNDDWFKETRKTILFYKEQNAIKDVTTVAGFGVIGGLIRSSSEKKKHDKLVDEISNLNFPDDLLRKYFLNIVIERDWNVEVVL